MEFYLVGGAIRDLLQGRCPHELDFVFSGCREDFLSTHPDARPVGKSIKVCLWQGRECMPLQGGHILKDLATRDLTVNALALDSTGRLFFHPQALEDLQNKILRPASSGALARDPARVYRLARFAALWPDWQISEEAIEQMRSLSTVNLATLPAERVGRELIKALHGAKPGHFFKVLVEGKALLPWFKELADTMHIPAGSTAWQENSVLGHSLRIMNAVAGDPLAAWMALCHDLGKMKISPAMLPHHYEHKQRGVDLAVALARRLRLSAIHAKAGALSCTEHMKAGIYEQLRPATRRDLLWRVHHSGFGPSFWRMIDAKSGKTISATAMADLQAILSVHLPVVWRDKGRQSANYLRQMHCRVLAEQIRHRNGVLGQIS